MNFKRRKIYYYAATALIAIVVVACCGRYGLFGLLGATVFLAGLIMLVQGLIDLEKKDSGSYHLDREYQSFRRKARDAFDRKTAKRLTKIFQHQCSAAEGESRRFDELTANDESRRIRELNRVVRFESRFSDYANKLISAGFTTEAAVAAGLEKGQKILTDFSEYLEKL